MQDLLDSFASENDLTVSSFEFDGIEIEVELTGPESPETTDLVLDLLEISGNPDTPIRVYFSQRIRLETTTSTTSPDTSESPTTTEP